MRWRAVPLLAAVALFAVAASLGPPRAPAAQSPAEAAAKSAGCVGCHTATDSATMHGPGVVLGCTDCHGGDASVTGTDDRARRRAHVAGPWSGSANPERSYTRLNRASPEFVRFVNPSDYRVVRESCGACHLEIIEAAERSLMATGAMFWGAATYNNGILPYKASILGEAYTREGDAAALTGPVPVTEAMAARSIVERLVPMPAWEVIPPGEPFRIYEPGGFGAPKFLEPLSTGLREPGRPSLPVSSRGPGTGLRVAGPPHTAHKTRLNDPMAWFLGTNDQPGDYRSSGCAACHVVYANDADPAHSGPYAAFGHGGTSASADPTVPRGEAGHPLEHRFTRAIPTSQCMVCHMHQPNVFVNSFLGTTMWDYEVDAPVMWPAEQARPSIGEKWAVQDRNPEGAAVRGSWGDPAFLDGVSSLPTEQTRFADYHGHGWNFREIFKRDLRGNLLDADGAVLPADDLEHAVHLASGHLEAGMHCVDCHFSRDAHGTGHLVVEVAAAVEIACVDCHGSVDRYPDLRTSGPAAPPGGSDLSSLLTSDGRARFAWRDGALIQRSALDPDLEWRVTLVKDTVDPDAPAFNPKAARAKLMGPDQAWGPGVPAEDRAHKDTELACQSCHLSWTTSCAGCHLNAEANVKAPVHHYDDRDTKGWASYNPQVARDDLFQLGRHGTARGGVIAPVRSSSAVLVSSTDARGRVVVHQQAPISSAGFSSQAFAPHFPHTVRKTETKACSACHVSDQGDNNALIAQVLLQGTDAVAFVGHEAWIGGDGGVSAVTVTEWTEPQAVIGSYLQRFAYPDDFAAHVARDRALPHAVTRAGGATGCVQLRGEWLFAAEGDRGLLVYDVAQIDHADASQAIRGERWASQDLVVEATDAACVALPTTQPVDPDRVVPGEQPLAPIYRYAVVADRVEGLILVDVTTLVDGDPRNDRLSRAVTFDGGGVLVGARDLVVAGSIVWVSAGDAVVGVDVADPLAPAVLAVVPVSDPRGLDVQFRYLFVAAFDGLRVIDVTVPARATLLDALVPMAHAGRLSVSRTWAYVADGPDGLAIVDVLRPTAPALFARFTDLVDARDVAIGATNASFYAYVADGAGGLKVLQLVSPDSNAGFYGYSPEPRPELIASYPTKWPALSVSRGLERDRAVDETGGQIAVFGRIGSRPFTWAEMAALYLHGDTVWTVSDEVDLDHLVR